MSTEEFATQEGVEAAAPESAPVETTEETQTPTQETEQSAQSQDTSVESGSDPQPKAVKELIEQRKRRQRAEQEAAYWRGQAEARATQQPAQVIPPQPPTEDAAPIEPNIDSFESYDAYEKAREKYLLDVAEHRITQKFRQQAAQQRLAQQQNQVVATFEQRFQEAAKNDPSLIEIRNDNTLPVSPAMASVIHRSEMAPQILKWLDSNRQHAAALTQLNPMETALELGRLEGFLKATTVQQATKKVSEAPKPISTVAPTSTAVVDEENLPMEEYYRRRTKQLYGR